MISREEALSLYRKLLLARLSEEKIRELYPQNDLKTPVHLGIGGESIPIGVCHCLPPGTKFFGTYRNHTLYLALTNDTDGFFGELYGKITGGGKGKAGSMHLTFPDRGLMATSAVVATTIPLAVGAAFASRYRETDDCSVVFFGDGAMEEGAFWESLNFACLHRLPVLFVCEDNSLAIHAHAADRRGFLSALEAVRAFDCHSASGNGASLSLVIEQTREMLARMSVMPRPGFLHFTYHRFLEHVGPKEDYNAGYRNRPPAGELEKMEPLRLFAAELSSLGCSTTDRAAIEAAVKEQINCSVRNAQAAPFPSAAELYTDVLA